VKDRHHRGHPQGPADDRVAGRHPGPLVRRRGGRDQPVLALLQKLGVKAQVVVIHQGDSTVGANGPNDCNLAANGPLSAINARVSATSTRSSAGTPTPVQLQAARPQGPLRTVIQSLSFGRLLSGRST
jgi:hypothetical protein